MKPILVINCSGKKHPSSATAFDLYKGEIFTMLKANMSNYKDYFEEILILSAEHGLITGSEHIEHYNTQMSSRNNKQAIAQYASKHEKNTKALLRRFADSNRDIFICLTNDYRCAFDAMLGAERKSLLKYRRFYISEGQLGIGDLKGRLKRVINVAKGTTPELKPVYQRSGIANTAELGFAGAGNHIGSSLAHANTEKNSTLLAALLDVSNYTSLFLDNGLITFLGRGENIDSSWVFAEYKKIVDSLNLAQLANISVVIPDDVVSNDRAQAIVKQYKKEILYLAKRCRVILPVHKSQDIRAHATKMMETLNFHPNIALGVPCLSTATHNLMLPLADIDALLSLKVKRNKADVRPMFQSVHYFGLSDATGKAKLAPRLSLAHLHNIETTLDCTRTTAIFGRTSTGYRQGTEIENGIREEYAKPQVLKSKDFKNYGAFQEYHQLNSEPAISDWLYAMINEDEIFEFIRIYNEKIMDKHYPYQMPQFDEHEDDDAIQMAWDLTSQSDISNLILEWCKEQKWAYFRKDNAEVDELEYDVYRFETIKKVFSAEDTPTIPVQMQLKLGQVA